MRKVKILLCTMLLLVPGLAAFASDPSTAPIPDFSDILSDTRRALYVEVVIRGNGTAEILSVGVTRLPPPATDDDPPLLLFELYDGEGQLLGSQDAWDPRYEYEKFDGIEQVVLVEEATAFFQIPFDHRITRIKLLNQQSEPPVDIIEIYTRAVVEDFCVANPQDDNCDGFAPGAPDQDGDGVVDSEDNCISVTNADQTDTDGDTQGDACDADDDNDSVDDTSDNCSLISNANQKDFDGDGDGDACDTDDDGDDVLDDGDSCPNTPSGALVDVNGCSAEQRDSDNDEVTDANDLCPDTAPGADIDVNGCADAQRDSDGDGVNDDKDACPATPLGTEVDESGCQSVSEGQVCDVDLDNDVDIYDIYRILFSPNRRNLAPGDPRDANENGSVDFQDLLICIGNCDRQYCATS